MTMKQIRMRLVSLVESHDERNCAGCKVCDEINVLRANLKRDPVKPFEKILSKGQDMTKSDIEKLIKNGVQKTVIQKALHMHNSEFRELMLSLGFVKTRVKKEKKEKEREQRMPKISLAMYQDFNNQGLSDKEIAAKVGMNHQYLSQLKKQWGIRPEVTADKAPKKEKSVSDEPVEEFEISDLHTEIRLLKERLAEAQGKEDASKQIIKTLKAKLEEYENNQNEPVVDEHELSFLRTENRLIRDLLKFWM